MITKHLKHQPLHGGASASRRSMACMPTVTRTCSGMCCSAGSNVGGLHAPWCGLGFLREGFPSGFGFPEGGGGHVERRHDVPQGGAEASGAGVEVVV